MKEKLFYFETFDGRVVPLLERHALVQGFASDGRSNYKEYLGMLETDDAAYLEKTVDEIKMMNLPKVMPKETRKSIISRRTGWKERTYSSTSEI